MSNTLRKVADVITLYPSFVEAKRLQVDPLDHELAIIRAINWELSKLGDDHAAVARIVQFVMQHRGFEITDFQKENVL
jgi:hypothetical protein